jgi:outer membrane usher protein
MRKMTAVVMTLRAPNGQWIPAGTTAALRGGGHASEVTVGYDGEVYMQSPPPGAQLIVPLTSGDCVVALPSPLPDSGWVDLGEVPCR